MIRRPARSAFSAFLLVIALAPPATATDSVFELALSGAQTVTTEPYAWQHQYLGIQGTIEAGPVSILGELHLQNDAKYSEGHGGGYWLGFNGTLEQGGVVVALAPFTARVGRFYHGDQVESPYSLFVSSRDLSAPMIDLELRTANLFYSARSLELNRVSSARGYPDRGAAIRGYGIRSGALRVGFQDVIVFADRTFDLEYLVNPIPGFLLQYLKRTAGTPWAISVNHNSILGFFGDYTADDWYAYGQVLIDDINFNRYVLPDAHQNPDKVAWSFGGALDTPIGRVGLYHAGATMYTFQAYGGGGVGSASDTRYGYTYYPDVEYAVDGEERVIFPEENYIGYLHGENNVSFMATLDTRAEVRARAGEGRAAIPVDIASSLELTVSGSKSPANPWHELTTFPDSGNSTRLLDEDRLETRLTARAGARAPVGGWMLHADASLGFIWNELELTAVPDELAGTNNEIRYFSPGAGSRPVASLRLGASYALRYGRGETRTVR